MPLSPGYGPADLSSAYALPANGGAGQTVAIVDAFDDPNAEADLATYRAQFGLPACTTANGCFRKVDQRGGTNYPPPNAGWAGEISLDVDMVSAVAPAAHILLVEADDNGNDNLGAAVDEAVALGAKYVSNSYGTGYTSAPGSGEDPSEVTDGDPHYNHPGVAVVASTGDDDFGVSYPAASQYVTAVGGTTLVPDSSARGWSESVWNNSFGGPGSGCSLYEAKPAWQTDSGCDMRTEADVSADADPLTGVAVYDTYQDSGWGVFGGTSASSPDHRECLRRCRNAGREHVPVELPVRERVAPQRRDDREQRHVLADLPVHGRHGLRRPDRSRHPERSVRVHHRPARS